jgi:hypothetical protein
MTLSPLGDRRSVNDTRDTGMHGSSRGRTIDRSYPKSRVGRRAAPSEMGLDVDVLPCKMVI